MCRFSTHQLQQKHPHTFTFCHDGLRRQQQQAHVKAHSPSRQIMTTGAHSTSRRSCRASGPAVPVDCKQQQRSKARCSREHVQGARMKCHTSRGVPANNVEPEGWLLSSMTASKTCAQEELCRSAPLCTFVEVPGLCGLPPCRTLALASREVVPGCLFMYARVFFKHTSV